MELAAYAVMAAGAYVALITRERIVLYGWFALYVLYSLIVRLAPPIIDMEVYARALTLWPPPLSFYTLREPVVWLGGPVLHRLLNDQVATFLVVDVLTGLIVFRSMKTLDDGSGRMLSLAPAPQETEPHRRINTYAGLTTDRVYSASILRNSLGKSDGPSVASTCTWA